MIAMGMSPYTLLRHCDRDIPESERRWSGNLCRKSRGVHNVTAQFITFTPIVNEATLDEPRKVVLEDTHPSHLLQYDRPSASGFGRVERFGCRQCDTNLTDQLPTGAFVGALTQVSSPDGLIEDIPLRTANIARNAAGAYPLRWQDDYTNLVTITNTSTKELTARSLITVGGITYVPKDRVIPSGRTAIYDVDATRQTKEKDVNGKVMPRDTPYGKFMWFDSSMGGKSGLMGRNSVTSRANRRKSSFSCGQDCDYFYRKFPTFEPDPFQFVPHGNSLGGPISDVTYYSNGQTGYYPYSFTSTDLTSSDPNIISYGADSNSSTSYVAAAGFIGSATGSYSLTEFNIYSDMFNYCQYDQTTSQDSGPAGTASPCPIPTGESTQYVRQVLVDIGFPTASDFLQPLETLGNDNNAIITEAENAVGTDNVTLLIASSKPYKRAIIYLTE